MYHETQATPAAAIHQKVRREIEEQSTPVQVEFRCAMYHETQATPAAEIHQRLPGGKADAYAVYLRFGSWKVRREIEEHRMELDHQEAATDCDNHDPVFYAAGIRCWDY